MAETAPPILLEATLAHVRMELEGKTAQKVSLEKPSLRTFPGCKWPFCRRRRWILGRTVSDKTSAGVIVSLLLSSCLFRLRIMNCRETWLNFFPSFQSIVSWRLPTIWLSIGLSSYLLPGSVSFARLVVHAPSPPVQGMTLTHLISWVQSQSTLGSSYVLFSKHVCPIELYQRLKKSPSLTKHSEATCKGYTNILSRWSNDIIIRYMLDNKPQMLFKSIPFVQFAFYEFSSSSSSSPPLLIKICFLYHTQILSMSVIQRHAYMEERVLITWDILNANAEKTMLDHSVNQVSCSCD